MKSFLLFCFALVVSFVSGQTNLEFSFTYQDSVRAYKVYVPQKYLDNPSVAVPLLLNLHGLGSENWRQEFYGDFRPIADNENFIICHPNGTFDATGKRFWNAGFGSAIDDVGFLSALIDTLKANYNINDQKVFSTGMSNGGFMSLTLACELPDKVKAVASVTGSMTINQMNNCTNTNPIPVMQIHGTADPTVAYNGSIGVSGIEALVGYWVNHNSCDSVATISNVPNNDTTDSSTATRYDFNQNCGDEAAVVFYKIQNGGHTWPGSAFLLPNAVTNLDFDASAVMWKFFCPDADINNIRNVNESIVFDIVPNPIQAKFQINVAKDNTLENVYVFDVNGSLLLQSQNSLINLESVNAGVYFVKIMTKKGVATRRVEKL